MKIHGLTSGLVLLILAACMPLAACPAEAQTAATQLSDLNYNVNSLQAEVDLADKKLTVATERYKVGQTTQSELDEAQGEAGRRRRELQKAKQDRDAAATRVAFTRPVTIRLDHSTVRQFASALSTATGIPVNVDAKIPSENGPALTLEAEAVPFASVLESIAEKTDLMISPDQTGVILRPWPHLNERVFRSPTAPWSSDWGVPPTVNMQVVLAAQGYAPLSGANGGGSAGFGGGAPGTGGFGGLGGGGQAPQGGASGYNPFGPIGGGGQPPRRGDNDAANPFGGFGGGGQGGNSPGGGFQPGMGGFGGGGFQPGQGSFGGFGVGGLGGAPMGGPGMGFTVGGIGDHLIAIAEPGMGERGEPGVWMTAYQFDSSGFHRIARGFHPFAATPGGFRPGAGGNPRRAPGSQPSPRGQQSQQANPFGGAAPSGTRSNGGQPGR